MNITILFIKKEYKKVIATCLVAIAFLYFWVNGPLLQELALTSLEKIETKYSKPVLVGTDGVDKKDDPARFNTIVHSQEKAFGHGLLISNKKELRTWGLVADKDNSPALSPEHAAKILKHARELGADSSNVYVKPSMELFYALTELDGKKVVYLESTDVVRNIRGYAGEVHVGVFINSDGSIRSVHHIASQETPSYLADIQNSGFYDQFRQVSLIQGDQEIDAITGATLTSKAIAKTVSELVNLGTPYPIINYVTIDDVNTFGVSAKLNEWWIVHILVIGGMFLFGFQKKIKKSKKSILVLSLLSVIYIGFFLNNSFTYISFLHPFLGTSVSSFVGLYALFVLIGAIWGKNTYCKYVCPFGNVQRIILQMSPKKAQRKFFISNAWVKKIRITLTIILTVGVLLGMRNWSNFELFPDLFGWSTLGVWFIISLITVLTTMVYPMLWCRLLCPTGSILDGLKDLVHPKKYSLPGQRLFKDLGRLWVARKPKIAA